MAMLIFDTDDDVVYNDHSSATFHRIATPGVAAVPSGFWTFGAVDLIVAVPSKL